MVVSSLVVGLAVVVVVGATVVDVGGAVVVAVVAVVLGVVVVAPPPQALRTKAQMIRIARGMNTFFTKSS